MGHAHLGTLRLLQPLPRGAPLVGLLVALILLLPLSLVGLLMQPASLDLGVGAGVAALALATLSVRAMRRTIEFHEHGVRRGGTQLLYRELDCLRIDVVRNIDKYCLSNPEQMRYELAKAGRDFALRFAGARGRIRVRVGGAGGAANEALTVEIERAAAVVAESLTLRLSQRGELPFGTMARLTRDGIEARETPRLLGPTEVYQLAWAEIESVQLVINAAPPDRHTSHSEARPYLYVRGAGRHVRIDCADDNVHATCLVLLDRLEKAGRPLPRLFPARLPAAQPERRFPERAASS